MEEKNYINLSQSHTCYLVPTVWDFCSFRGSNCTTKLNYYKLISKLSVTVKYNFRQIYNLSNELMGQLTLICFQSGISQGDTFAV